VQILRKHICTPATIHFNVIKMSPFINYVVFLETEFHASI
jgi:hypothetical protein